MEKCPACTTSRSHTDKFEKIFAAISAELEKREITCVDDKQELAMALSVLVADSLDMDIYK
ncbi:MAG: hypothetical protein P8013_13675 [Candidatus Sulfobium sp.]|jgi:hypothetical protein